jgi:hypothetical protein
VTELTPAQQRRRSTFETLIRLMEPGLNLILATGDRLSRLVEPEDYEYYPGRPLEPAVERARAEADGGSVVTTPPGEPAASPPGTQR